MGKSIIHNGGGCFICGRTPTEEHHIFYGTANRRLSDEYGLTCRLCPEHHRAVHAQQRIDLDLKQYAQSRFEAIYPAGAFQRIFGKNYI